MIACASLLKGEYFVGSLCAQKEGPTRILFTMITLVKSAYNSVDEIISQSSYQMMKGDITDRYTQARVFSKGKIDNWPQNSCSKWPKVKLNLWNISFLCRVNIVHKTIVLESNCRIIYHFAKVIVRHENNLLFLMSYINSERNHK